MWKLLKSISPGTQWREEILREVYANVDGRQELQDLVDNRGVQQWMAFLGKYETSTPINQGKLRFLFDEHIKKQWAENNVQELVDLTFYFPTGEHKDFERFLVEEILQKEDVPEKEQELLISGYVSKKLGGDLDTQRFPLRKSSFARSIINTLVFRDANGGRDKFCADIMKIGDDFYKSLTEKHKCKTKQYWK